MRAFLFYRNPLSNNVYNFAKNLYMKFIHLQRLLFINLIILHVSCGKDDNSNETPSEELVQEQMETTTEISNGATRTWRVSNAILNNENGTFDISSLFNIRDDEFLFSSDQRLEWRRGYGVNAVANSVDDAKTDYYRSVLKSEFSYIQGSSTVGVGINGSFNFEVINQNSISGTIDLGDNGQSGTLEVMLVEKLASDNVSLPTGNFLNFSEVNSFLSEMVPSGSIGFQGSHSDNSLYIATRETGDINSEGIEPEKIFKLSLETNTFTTNNFFQHDFVTKSIHFIEDNLVIAGGSYINYYNPENIGIPISVAHNANQGYGLTRFGASAVDNLIYISGGDINPLEDVDNTGNTVRKFNTLTAQIEDVVPLPQTRYKAGTAIVNDRLFIFGGQLVFNTSDTGESESYILDLDNGSLSSFDLPVPLAFSYTAVYENLIYVGGTKWFDDDGDGNNDNWDIFFGVYNTIDDTFTELDHNLDDSDTSTTIYALTFLNDKLYVVYGLAQITTEPEIYYIMEASIQ